ncbi:MAG: hypothetical protein E7143_08710 [Rikenellaceae bacterium]|nr:hypothetical protein [Rikenellaceae bacterium]
MKNIFRFLMAVAVLFTASCTKEDISSSIGGGEVEVTFSASLPELGTRAYADGAKATTLRYYVYEGDNYLRGISSETLGTTTLTNGKAVVTLPLLKGMTYNIIFWADNGSDIYTIDPATKVLSVDYTGVMSNDDSRDAFYKYLTNVDPTDAVKIKEQAKVTLTRPFGQLNAATSDYDNVENNGVKLTTSSLKVTTFSKLNLETGVATDPVEVTFDATAMPCTLTPDKEILKSGYEYLSMNYLLPGTVDAEYTFKGKRSDNSEVEFTGTTYTNVPVKANYRTNILGKLLTASTEFTVTIEKDFFEPDKDIVQTAAELQQQIDNAPVGEETEIVLGGDIDLNDLLGSLGTLSTRAAATPSLTIAADKNIVLDLNGYTLSATEESTGSYGLITNKGTLTINDSKGSGKIELTATQNRGWNAYSSVISNNPGGVLIVNDGTIEHLGGTDMAYGIDNLTNGKGTSAVATINGGAVKSTYIGIRQFLNGIEATNSLTVKGGEIHGVKRSIWMQGPSANKNSGNLEVTAAAKLYGNAYISTAEGTADWDVSMSIAAAALQDGFTVAHGILPEGYAVVEENGVWTVNFVPVAKIGDKEYGTLGAAVAAVQDGETITFVADIEQVDGVIITDKNLTIDLNGKTFTVSEGASTNNRNFKINGSSVVTIKNGTMVAAGEYSSGAYGTLRTEDTANVTLEGVKLYNYRGNGLNVKALSGTTVTINNTDIYSQYGGGVEAAGGNVVLNNVTIDQKGMYTAPYNSMTISVNGGGVATVNSGTYSTVCITTEEANNQGTSHGPWCAGVLNSGGKLIINGGTFANDNFGDNALATYARGLLLADTGANIQINGGTFNALKAIVDVTNNLGDASRNPSVALAGGDFSADPRISGLYASNLISVAEGCEVTEENGRWILNFIPAAKIGETTYNTLQEAIEAVQNGETIIVNRNATFNEDNRTSSGGTWYEGVYYIGDKSFTIDLNNNTISQNGAVNDYMFLFKNEGEKANTITFKNGTIDAGTAAYCALCTSTTSTQKITINLDNVNLIGNNSNGAVAKIRGGAELNVNAGTVITGKDSYVGIEAFGNNTVVNINEGAKIYQNGTSSYVGSLAGASGGATINVYGGEGVSALGGFIAMTSGGTVNISGGNWTANTDGTYANSNNSVLISQSANGAKCTVNVTGGTFKGGYNCYGDAVGDATINIYGGNFNANPDTYVTAAGYATVENNDGTFSVVAE